MIESLAWSPLQPGCRDGSRSAPTYILFHNPGSGFTVEGATDVFRIGDQGLLAAIFQEPDDRLDLGSHGAFGKVYTFGEVLLRFGQPHFIQPLLIGFSKVDGNLLYSGRNEEQFGTDLLCKQRGSKVLIDDRGCSFILTITSVNDGDATATDG